MDSYIEHILYFFPQYLLSIIQADDSNFQASLVIVPSLNDAYYNYLPLSCDWASFKDNTNILYKKTDNTQIRISKKVYKGGL